MAAGAPWITISSTDLVLTIGENRPCLPWGKCSCKFIGRISKNTISVGNSSPVNPVSTESPSTYIHIAVYIYWYSGSQQQPLRLCKAIQEGVRSANNHYCSRGYAMEKISALFGTLLTGHYNCVSNIFVKNFLTLISHSVWLHTDSEKKCMATRGHFCLSTPHNSVLTWYVCAESVWNQ